MVLVFLVIYTRSRLEALGLAVYPMAFALILIANLTQSRRSGIRS
jgi:hypothetical protein